MIRSHDLVTIATPIATVLAVLVGSWLSTLNQKRKTKRDELIERYETFYVPVVKWFYEINPDSGVYNRMSWKDPKVTKMDEFITQNIKWVSPKILKIYIKYYRAAHEQGFVKTDRGLDIDPDLIFGKASDYFDKQQREIAEYFTELEIAIIKDSNKISRKLKLPAIGQPLLENLQDMNLLPQEAPYKLKRRISKWFHWKSSEVTPSTEDLTKQSKDKHKS